MMEKLKEWVIEVAVKKLAGSAIRAAALGILGWLMVRNDLLVTWGIVSDAAAHTTTIYWDKLSGALIVGLPALIAIVIKLFQHTATSVVKGQSEGTSGASKIMGLALLLALLPTAGFAWNPVNDVRDNLTWTFGKKAEVGVAVKVAGAGDLKKGETATSMLAGVFDYRFLCFSYGGTRVNRNAQNFTDTIKVGFKVTNFFGWFKNPPTPEMGFLQNLNIGPSFSMPVFTAPRAGTVFVDGNYSFGGKIPSGEPN